MEENKNNVEQAVENPVEPTKKEQWASRYKGKYSPDSDTVDMESDDYYENLNKMADENERMAGNEAAMNDAISKNPSFGGFISDAKNGVNFVVALTKRYGKDFLEQAMQDPDIMDELAKAEEEHFANVQKQAEEKETTSKNTEESISNLNSFVEENGLNEEQANKLITDMVKVVGDGLNGIFSKDFMNFVWKGSNYDNDVKEAEDRGQIIGRNENIEAKLEESEDQGDLPPNLGGPGSLGAGEKPEAQQTFFNPFSGKREPMSK